ncbi:MAG TPA: hypothetical protein VL547_13815 [Dinghuibacter sp.]|jgi:PAS domain-containing protein|uniref:hypothetical protein n=1 Tax=Dinghuibacter sp. TaxID=2024697 RepID=UPI002BBD69CE|nr:hypothetical protein [Dinghuibacter sp.]HTJ13105.1 hypothetical protein [Dinghuibacter sp.]
MPMYNTYSFTKSDFAAMLQHIVDLIPDWMFLYDPAEDLVVYHNQKNGNLFESTPGMPARLRDLLEPIVLPEDMVILERNTLTLRSLDGPDIREVRFRVRSAGSIQGYRWYAFRQKLFWQDETGVKLILCIGMEIRQAFEGKICYS